MLRLAQVHRHLSSRTSAYRGLNVGRSFCSAGKQRVSVLDSEIAYVDTEQKSKQQTLVFLHGNPTSSFLWRKPIKVLSEKGYRCIAPDLVGFGDSGVSTKGYKFNAHAEYLDAFFSTLKLNNIVLIIHDWGSALGFRWARLNPEKVNGIVHMESIVQSMTWDEFPQFARKTFQNMRTEGVGEKMVIEKNFFVERLLLGDKVDKENPLTEEEKAEYMRRFTAKENREPTLVWPRELPISGTPTDVVDTVNQSFDFMSKSQMPKLFIEANPGFFSKLIKEKTSVWPNQEYHSTAGLHFLQEDSGVEIGNAVADWLSKHGLDA